MAVGHLQKNKKIGEKMLQCGDKAPDFTLPDAYNNKISLNNFFGKKIILWFFPKASTPG